MLSRQRMINTKINYLRNMQRFLCLLLLLFTSNCWGQFQFKEQPKLAKNGVDLKSIEFKRKQKDSEIHQIQTLKIAAVGDIMLGTNYPSEKYLPKKEFLTYKNHSSMRVPNFFDEISPFFKSHNIVFGNLEGTFFDSTGEVKKCSDTNACYAFRQPTEYVKALSDAGFNLLSVANNHIGDFGIDGINSTHRILKKEGIFHAGTSIRPVDFMNINGIKIGFIGVATGTDCNQIQDTQKIKILMDELNTFCDLIIVSFHGGAEGNKHTHVPRSQENYLNENRGNVYEFAHFCIDHGADVLLGHGPHVPRGMEIYKNRLIAYSLGNFCTYSRFNLSKNNGLAPILSFEIDKAGIPIRVNIESFKQIKDGGPISDWRHRAKHRILKLSKQDFPDSYSALKTIMH